MDAESLARLSAWPAVVCYAATLMLRSGLRSHAQEGRVRAVWTVGWLFLMAHVIYAWLSFHDGSWSAAYEHTAARTQDAVGWNWGGGVWLNLLTAIIWGIDVARMWARRSVQPTKFDWWDILCQPYLGFMIFNATVVFGSRTAQIVGGAICVGLVILWGLRWRRGTRGLSA